MAQEGHLLVSMCVFFTLLLLFQINGSEILGTRTRSFPNGTLTVCEGIICQYNEIFVPCTSGDGKKDTCAKCPQDKPVSIEKFDSSSFEEPPTVCQDPKEKCQCYPEAELMNHDECMRTLQPVCKCNTSAGYVGENPNLCMPSEKCKEPGYELLLNDTCHRCSEGTYKDISGFGKCQPQQRCEYGYVIDNPGDYVTKRTCKKAPTSGIVTSTITPKLFIIVNTTNNESSTSIDPEQSVTTEGPQMEKDLQFYSGAAVIEAISVVVLVTIMMSICINQYIHRRCADECRVRRLTFTRKFLMYGPCKVTSSVSSPEEIPLQIMPENSVPFHGYTVNDYNPICTKNQARNLIVLDSFRNEIQSNQVNYRGETSEWRKLPQLSQGSLAFVALMLPEMPMYPTDGSVTEDTKPKEQIAENNVEVDHSILLSQLSTGANALDMNSLLSSETTSTESQLYELKWALDNELNITEGYIEYTNALHRQYRSKPISAGQRGRLIIRGSDVNGINFEYVSSTSGTQPYVTVHLIKIDQKEFESLKKSGCVILDMNSFELVAQQRPDNDVPISFEESINQPHQIPLPNETNQVDSGISAYSNV